MRAKMPLPPFLGGGTGDGELVPLPGAPTTGGVGPPKSISGKLKPEGLLVGSFIAIPAGGGGVGLPEGTYGFGVSPLLIAPRSEFIVRTPTLGALPSGAPPLLGWTIGDSPSPVPSG